MKKDAHRLPFLLTLLLAFCLLLSPVQKIHAQATASSPSDAPNEAAIITEAQGEKTISLELFMQKFQRVYKVYFSYQAAALKEIRVLDADMGDGRPKDPGILLKKVLTPVGLTFETVSNVYIIKHAAEIY